MATVSTFALLVTIVTIFNQQVESSNPNLINVPDVVKEINDHNRESGSQWQADTYGHEIMDMEKFVRQRLGTKLKKLSPEEMAGGASAGHQQNAPALPNADDLPKSFNWADTKRTNCPIGQIRDQANCGSCWAVSTAAAFADRVCIKSKGKIRIPLSADYITACDTSNAGCNGGYMHLVNQFVQKNGIITGGDYESDVGCKPYSIRPCGHPHQLPCPPDIFSPKCKGAKCSNDWYRYKVEKPEHTYKAKAWRFLKNETEMMREIYDNGPLTAGFAVYLDFIFYKGGIYIKKDGMPMLGGHAVRVVGWGEEGGVKYWIVANSWSTLWGEKGFFRIKRGVNMCWFEGQMSALTPDL